MATISYPLSSQPLEFLTMTHSVIFSFSSFSGCLEMYSESSIPLSEFVACPSRHPICSIFASLEVMPRVYIVHLPVAYDDITGQLANDNDNYKFSACSNSVLQEFVVETEVMIISHPEVVRGIHVRHIDSSKVLQRITSVTHALEIP